MKDFVQYKCLNTKVVLIINGNTTAKKHLDLVVLRGLGRVSKPLVLTNEGGKWIGDEDTSGAQNTYKYKINSKSILRDVLRLRYN